MERNARRGEIASRNVSVMLTLIAFTAVNAALGSTLLLWPVYGPSSLLLAPFAASLVTTLIAVAASGDPPCGGRRVQSCPFSGAVPF